ncbi:MAG TPA: glycosyltransferase family 39 protein, partial [Thermodesulfovibrionales bacterium]|nr:glycosyltransferase family 39 protein [Thermodesulfovibrionales bacterium]
MRPSYSWKNSTERVAVPGRRDSLLAAGVIFLYCLAFLSCRLLVSSSMEADESEQFLDSSVLSIGYLQHAPLYTWIVKGAFLMFGRSLVTLLIIKYSLIFSLYFILFLIARHFWDTRESLIITGALLLFPTYSYEAHRDLSHTILVSVMAAATCLLYIGMMKKEKTIYYPIAGIFIGLGILSKYNFV